MLFRSVPAALLGLLLPVALSAQVVINEVQSANLESFADEDGDYKDWFELYNAGTEAADLSGWGVSDNTDEPMRWILPELTLAPGEHLLIWASGKDRGSGGQYYSSAVVPSATWSYLLPVSEPASSWRLPGFDASGWPSGPGGFGYADGDDGTTIGATTSVYARTTFTIDDLASINDLRFHMDFDDGFVAYLNGTEIARVNVGTPGIPPLYTDVASGGHEAQLYQGIAPDSYPVDQAVWQSALVEGENVLAIQVYNTDLGSSDLSGNAWLTFGTTSPIPGWTAPPAWMGLVVTSGELHTNFALTSGEPLVLTNALSVQQDFLLLPQTDVGSSFARTSSGSDSWCYFPNATPNDENSTSTCFAGREPQPVFSIGSGMFNTYQVVELSTTSPTAEIRYTTDGSVPTASSALYSAPILLDATAILSARCFSTGGLLPSFVEKNTYLIDEDYLTVPVISITTNPENLWDENIGIYVYGPPDYGGYPYFGANFWEDWERASYIEYFTPDGTLQFEGPVGLKIHGGWSRALEQKSFRIVCRDDYGMDEIEYPLMADKPFIDTWKSFNLRNGGNDYYGQRYHDALMQRSMKGTNADYMGYTPVVTFLNGEYWGMYELRENLDENYVEDNHGIPADDVTVISSNYLGWNVINGSDASFYALHAQITAADPQSPDFYDTFYEQIDYENLIDYIIAETYYENGDWGFGWNNTKFWKDDRPGGKWRFMLMDMDFGMGDNVCGNYLNVAANPGTYTGQIFAQLIQNETFRNQFVQRYFDVVNTNLQTENLIAIRDQMRTELDGAMPRHCQRWGSDYNWWYWGYDGRFDWNDQRLDCIDNVLQDHFGLGELVDITLDVVPAGAGRIHIASVEPSEGLYPWTGHYVNGIPVQITAIANSGYTFDHWAPNELFPVEVSNRQFIANYEEDITFTAYFTGEASDSTILISEFLYNDDNSAEDGDWVELYNPLSFPVDLSGMTFRDQAWFNDVEIPINTVLEPGAYLVLAQDPELFAIQHPGVAPVIGPWDFQLSNSSDVLRLYDHAGAQFLGIAYQDVAPWPSNTDGTGRSVEFTEGASDQGDPSNWFAGCVGGSPGQAYDPNCGLVSIEEYSAQGSWSVYPNPATAEVFVALEGPSSGGHITLLDLAGRTITEHSFGQRSLLRLETGHLPRGMYILRRTDATGTSTLKLTLH